MWREKREKKKREHMISWQNGDTIEEGVQHVLSPVLVRIWRLILSQKGGNSATRSTRPKSEGRAMGGGGSTC